MYEAAGKFKVLNFIVMRMLYSILTGFFRFACLARIGNFWLATATPNMLGGPYFGPVFCPLTEPNNPLDRICSPATIRAVDNSSFTKKFPTNL